MRYEYASSLHKGMVRENNEDSLAFDAEHGVAVLADGMGGYNAGEVASGMAVDHLNGAVCAHVRASGVDGLAAALCEHALGANRAIHHAANNNPEYSGMGTTLVMCVFRGDRVWMGHIGDSRGYRLRGDTLVQLTRDHSLLQDYLDAGLMTEEEAATSDLRSVVTRAMGVEPQVELDVQEQKVEPGDVYLLCSDGLSDMVDDATLRELLLAEPDLQRAADTLVAAANARGGRDNIAVLLARASSPE